MVVGGQYRNFAEVDLVLHAFVVGDLHITRPLSPELRSSKIAQTHRLLDTWRRQFSR